MAELTAGQKLEIMRAEVRIQQLEFTKSTQSLRIAEIEDEIRRIKGNFPDYEREIEEQKQFIESIKNPKQVDDSSKETK